ncbi:hypothetical protein C2E21_7855 [Chlorella sorokiniana]|uniref:MYND-type domain-containing protein n=1 Tax=Chlorella sorokiniana TaxID=3076 RepID=A0A2P6TGI9_CHLSO|nr:hypothetical protein C2E21_7855 [Chlorella sorokiniana]|eukprot:PRW33226.1 hypothetical protein C2E21_7855 [Chlorella sorokiniana]
MGGGSLGAIAKAHGEVFNQPGQAEAFVQQVEAAPDCWHACCSLVPLLPGIEQMAAELHTWQQQPEQLGPARLAAGRAAAVRACAFLGCPNVGAEGGMVAGQGAGAKRCGGCRSVWYCGPACSRADWKQHKAVCPLLRAEYERQAGAGGHAVKPGHLNPLPPAPVPPSPLLGESQQAPWLHRQPAIAPPAPLPAAAATAAAGAAATSAARAAAMAGVAALQRALEKLEQASAFSGGNRFDKETILIAADLQGAVQAAVQAGELANLSGAQKQALGRSLAAVLSPMATLEQPLAAALRAPLSSPVIYSQLWSAASAAMGGAQLVACLEPLPDNVTATLATGASLLVAAGTPLLAQLAAPASRQALRRLFANDPSQVDRTVVMLVDGLAHVGSALLVQIGRAPPAAPRRALLKGAFAPRRLLPFLAAAAGAVLGAADDPADHLEQAYPSAARLLGYLLVRSDQAKLHSALAADRPVLDRLPSSAPPPCCKPSAQRWQRKACKTLHWSTTSGPRRLMHSSLCAAHLEAMAALVRCTDIEPPSLFDDGHIRRSIGMALAGAPVLSLSSPAWRSLHAPLHQLLRQQELPWWSLSARAAALNQLRFMGAPIKPHVAAALLPSIAALLRECTAAPPPASFDKPLDVFPNMASGSVLSIIHAHGKATGIDQFDALYSQLPPLLQYPETCHSLVSLLPRAVQLAAELLAWKQQPEQLAPARLAAGRAAAVRACAYLGCPNVGAEGGIVAGQGAGAKRCGGCRSVWYCGPACSRADWKQHKAACPLLRAADAPDDNPSFLIVNTGGTAEIKEAGGGTYTLTLTGTPPTAVAFSDRPARTAVTIPVQEVWQRLNASDANPVNAALTYRSGDGDKVTLVEISSAEHNPDEATLTFAVRPLPLDHPAGAALNQTKEALSPGTWSDGVALYVDDITCCLLLQCWCFSD